MATVIRPLHPGALRDKTAKDPAPVSGPQREYSLSLQREPLGGAYFWLVAFFATYCARPEDWIPGLHVIPLAKVSGIFAALALALSIGRSKRRFQRLPVELWFTSLLTGWLTLSSLFSPVWRGGAFFKSLDFGKLLVAMLVGLLVVTSLARLRRLLFVQTISVIGIAVLSLAIGHSRPRLIGAVGGLYDNSNDLALAIALTIPLCLAFLLRGRGPVRKALWGAAGLVMGVTLLLTGSRSGAITFGIATLVCLWHFGIQGRRPHLILATIVAVVSLFILSGGVVAERFAAISGNTSDSFQTSAYESYRQRSLLIDLSLNAIEDHPLFGLGVGDFEVYSGLWKEVHIAYLQVAVEGGVFALVLYLLIFWRGFANLGRLRRMRLDSEAQLFAWALHAALVSFVVGALFSPVAYQYFPFFTVMYIAVLRFTVEEQSGPDLLPVGGRARSKVPWLSARI